jgi:hypothetical protein
MNDLDIEGKTIEMCFNCLGRIGLFFVINLCSDLFMLARNFHLEKTANIKMNINFI